MDVRLNPQLTEEHQRLILQYIDQPSSLARESWREALRAMDLLRTSIVDIEQHALTFGAFYERFVDAPVAGGFLSQLNEQADVDAASRALTRTYAGNIRRALSEIGLTEPTSDGLRLLLVFCLFWWTSFAKGYAMEIAIYRDLRASAIEFEAHDLHDPQGRYAPFDLIIDGHKGDIKTSTYFLYVARSFPMRCAFYITRVYDSHERTWQRLVLLKREEWDRIDGETVFRPLAQALSVPASPIETDIRGAAFVVVGYDLWKQHILRFQIDERGQDGEPAA